MSETLEEWAQALHEGYEILQALEAHSLALGHYKARDGDPPSWRCSDDIDDCNRATVICDGPTAVSVVRGAVRAVSEGRKGTIWLDEAGEWDTEMMADP